VLPIDVRALATLIVEKMKEVRANKLTDALRKLGVSKARLRFYGDVLRGDRRYITTGSLRKLCDELAIPYIVLEKKRLFRQYNFPYDLSSPSLWKLATHVINEGSIPKATSSVTYVNEDPVLHWYFKKQVEATGGTYSGPHPRKRGAVMDSYADATVSRKLHAIGVPYVKKTVNQPTIDLSRMDEDTWRYHVQTTLSEEGFGMFLLDRRKGTLEMLVGWGRSYDITKNVPQDLVESLRPGTYTLEKIRDIGYDLFKTVIECYPPFLMKEYRELQRRHSMEVPLQLWPRPRPWALRVTKDGRLVSDWIFETTNRKLVTILHEYYGMLPGTWKAEAFDKRYDFYVAHLGKKLDDRALDELEEIKRRFPYKKYLRVG